MKTDTELKLALAKMLPGVLTTHLKTLYWDNTKSPVGDEEVLDTELLHVCWLVEEALSKVMGPYCSSEWTRYRELLYETHGQCGAIHATWQQRTLALCEVKGIEV